MQPRPLIEQPRPEPETVTDLCGACLHAQGCHLRQSPDQPVHQCNEYDDGSRAQLAGRLVAVPRPSARSDRSPAEPSAGLCSNCDHRDDCRLPRPVGGVWHCEEYR